jgi:CxxC-x17-CxxC domain-containing protein
MEPNVADFFTRMQEKLSAIEKKIDTLIGQAAVKPQTAQAPRFHGPFQRSGHQERYQQARVENNFRDRILHKAICADCSKECEVPFKPTGDRPVYCKDCFSKRKDNTQFNSGYGDRAKSMGDRHAGRDRHERQPFYKKFADEEPRAGRSSGEKKKPTARKRKKSK